MTKTADKSRAVRLSDHFHKVRLTSLTLSISLILLTLYKDSAPALQALPVKIPIQDFPFILICLTVAATVSFIHASTIWSSEVKDLDSSLRSSEKMVNEVEEILYLCRSSISQFENSSSSIKNEYFEVSSTVRGLKLALIDAESLSNSLNRTLGDSDKERVIKAINEELGENYFGAPYGEAIEQLAMAVADALAKQSLPSPVSLISSAMHQSLTPSTPAGKALLTPENLENLRWQGLAIFGAISAFLTKSTEDAVLLIHESESHGKELIRRVDSVEQRVRDHFENDKENIRPELENLGNQLKKALTPLTRATRTTKVLSYGFDLAVPTVVYIVALAHAVGRIFGPIAPSASDITNSILARLASMGWWAEALALILFSSAITGLVLWSQYPTAGRRALAALHRFKNQFGQRQSAPPPDCKSEHR